MAYRYSAPAKINLTLDVLQRRPDGYHDLRSIFQTLALADEVSVSAARGEIDTLTVSGPESEGVPTDASNIVLKACGRMRARAAARGQAIPAVTVDLVKRIPSQAGLGGGSSDAAATLLALNGLFGLDLSRDELTPIAASLGADVPYFLTGGLCLVQGLGEHVTPLPQPLPRHSVVILKPRAGVSTAKAYAALDAVPDRADAGATASWLARDVESRMPLHNDFESVVFEGWPEIGNAYVKAAQAASAHGAYAPRLCGSGACLFVLAETEGMASAVAAELIREDVGNVWLTHTISGGSQRAE
jgi:4-diphosphocytidyl-2-C-methyl-D-erythritol kinase